MCDTIVALGNATANGAVIFGKNSDRDPNEAQYICQFPEQDHQPGEMVKCTYIEIPQVEHTYSVLLSKPFWIWGAEMGANQHGVVIGNEAIFSKVPANKEPGLIGMDFLRLALERSTTAFEAMQVIIQLLEKYGQSGNCGFSHPIYYHNSFLIADRTSAWVLETVDRQWVAEQVKNVRAISNTLTIETEWDISSANLINYAVELGLYKKQQGSFNVREVYSDFLYTNFSDAGNRHSCSTRLLRGNIGKISTQSMMQYLRNHRNDDPSKGLLGADICMHAGFGPVRISQTTGSMISNLADGMVTHWLTGTAAPCTGIFKPVWMEAGLPDIGPEPTGQFNPQTLWWQHELLHRETLRNYPVQIKRYQKQRDELEAKFLLSVESMNFAEPEKRKSFSADCFRASMENEKQWLEILRQNSSNVRSAPLHAFAWSQFNRESMLD